MDIVPSFFPENEDDGLVPAEFNDTPEAKIRRMVGVPEPAPERLITPMNPQGRAPRDGMGFSENVAGQFRSGGFAGAVAEAAELEAVKSGGEQFNRGGFSEQQFRNLPTSVRERIIAEANQPGNKEQKLQDAEDSFYAQVAYDNSKANLSVASVAGAIVGSIPTPENLGGLSGLLVRQFPALASRPILTAGIDAAATNLLADPIVQGSRMFSGAQADYDPTQTVLAPIIGFTIGAAGRAIPELPSMVRERQAAALGVEPAAIAPDQAAPVVTPRPSVADAAPAANVADAPRVEPSVDPVIAKAVDEAIGAEPVASRPADATINRDIPPPPDNVSDYISARKYNDAIQSQYVKDGEVVSSSRNVPFEGDLPPVGTWRIADYSTNYGREIEQLRKIKISDLSLPELRDGGLDITKKGDDATYAKWIKEGKRPPPIEVIAREDGTLAVADGHRRVLAAKSAGLDEIEAWVSDLVDSPTAKTPDGTPIKTSLTYELAQKLKQSNASSAQVMEIQMRFGDAIQELFRIKPEALTGDEAAYILNFRDVDALRGRVAKAVGERQQRLNSKPDGSGQGADAAEVAPRPALKVMRGPDGRINGLDLEASGLELAPSEDGRLLFRKRGTQPAQPLPPNQVQAGRPVADQGTPAPAPQAKPVTRVQRIEDVSRNLVQSFEALGREKRVKPGAQGQFDTGSGVIRVKSIADLDTVAHEVGHDFHLTKARQDVDGLVARHKLELQDLGTGDKKGNQEAFAELFRLYVVNRNFAEQKYPKAAADLDALLRSKFPKQAEALDAIRADLDAIHRAPSGELVTADTIQTPPPKFGDRLKELAKPDRDPSGRSIYSAFDALYTATVDRTHPVWKAVENLADIYKRRTGDPLNIKPVDDTYILARMLPGSHGTASIMMEHGVIPASGFDPQGPSLAGAIEKALGQKWDDKAFADFGGYLVARRMVAEYTRFFNGEIPNPPGKFSFADYQRAVADIEAANPQFRDAAQDVYGFLTNHLKRAFDKGLFSKEYYEAALKRVDYVPFVRDMADFAEDSAEGIGSGGRPAGLRFSLMKAFKGSQRSVQNPLESIFKRVHDLEYAIALNDTVSSLARLADTAGPGSGAIAEAIPSSQLKGQKVDVIEALKAAGKTANVDDADLQALILQAEDALGDSTWATLFRQSDINPGKEPIVFYWVNGERRALRLADGRFGRELFHALNAMPDIEKNWFVSTLQVAQQILRTGVTRAPDFLAVNFIRDQLTAAATAGRKYIPFVSAAKGVVDAVRKTADAKAYAARGGMAAGAISDAIDQSMFGRNVRALEKAGVVKNAMAGDYLGAGSALFKQGIKALELSEAGTRMGLYKSYFAQAKDMGLDDLNASTYAAFRATDYVDFRKAGASMGLLRRWVPFLNAAIQGTDREIRALADLPALELKRGRGEKLTPRELDRLKDARVALLRVTSMGAILGGGLALMNADEEEYQTAPKFTKDTNFLVKVNDTWLAIPKPFGATSAIVNAFEYGTDAALRNDPSLIGPWMEAAGKAFAPPTTNPLVSLAYDLPANYNRFQDRPIVPYYLQGVKPSEQYTAGTSELSKLMGAATGWSPMKIEYAISNLGGSSALNLLRASDLAMAKDAPEKQVYDWPIARRFVKNLARGNQATTEFFNLVGDKNGTYEQAENAYRVKVRNGERTAAEQFLRNLPEDERAWTVLQSQGFEATEKRLHPMQNAKDRAAVISGVLSQLNFNNLIREADIDRQNTTISRRDAAPIVLDKTTRARMIEGLQELQMVTTRNAMVAIGAKGTRGLNMVDPQPILDRLKAISPEAFGEFEDRLKAKKVYDFDTTVQAWPETKARLLRDGENADLSDLVPAGAKTKRKRRT